jgi:hypothetical protein
MSRQAPDRLPAGFAYFDEEKLPEKLPADFAGFDEDLPFGSSPGETSPRCAPQSCTAPSEARVSSQLLERLPGEMRGLVMSFAETLGATVTHIIPHGAPDPVFPRGAPRGWDDWRHLRDGRIFARAWDTRDRESFYERMHEAEEEKKRERQRRKEWLDRQRRIAHGWAKWLSWRGEAPLDAENFRREQEDAEASWLLALAARRAPLVRKAVKRNESKGVKYERSTR